jgi:hypothetical protein
MAKEKATPDKHVLGHSAVTHSVFVSGKEMRESKRESRQACEEACVSLGGLSIDFKVGWGIEPRLGLISIPKSAGIRARTQRTGNDILKQISIHRQFFEREFDQYLARYK